MESEIIIVSGKGNKEYVLNEIDGYKTVILLTELEFSKGYRGYNRNIQVGLSSQDITYNLFADHERVIVEPYDKNDFKAFMSNTVILKSFLESTDRKMYIVAQGENLKIKSSGKMTERIRNELGLEIRTYSLKKESEIIDGAK